MPLKQGLWLTLVDEAGEATPVACNVVDRGVGTWVLEAIVPPQVYPVTFVSAHLRCDGHHLGLVRFPVPITTATHETTNIQLRFPVDEGSVPACRRV